MPRNHERNAQRIVNPYAGCQIPVAGEEWQSYEAILVSDATDADADIRITFEEKASICIGAVSLLPCDNFRRMRRDVIARLKETGIRMLRWPGGNFAQEYYACLSGVFHLRNQLYQSRRELPEDVRISLDEWNVWYAWYRPSGVTDGIFTALALHMIMSEAKDYGIELACHFEAINEGDYRGDTL